MRRERLQMLCESGDNCSQVILRMAAEEYGFSFPEELLGACSGLHGGFGINGMCSGLVAAVMVLGLLCEEEELKEKRILFLLKAQETFDGLSCNTLATFDVNCIGALEEIMCLLETVLEE